MSERNDGGPAFPCSVRKAEKCMDEGGYGYMRTVTLNEGGMTLRDWFAGQALAGVATLDTPRPFEDDAATCYKFADAMLKAREQ